MANTSPNVATRLLDARSRDEISTLLAYLIVDHACWGYHFGQTLANAYAAPDPLGYMRNLVFGASVSGRGRMHLDRLEQYQNQQSTMGRMPEDHLDKLSAHQPTGHPSRMILDPRITDTIPTANTTTDEPADLLSTYRHLVASTSPDLCRQVGDTLSTAGWTQESALAYIEWLMNGWQAQHQEMLAHSEQLHERIAECQRLGQVLAEDINRLQRAA